jgi:hypothetical protein
MVEDDFLFSPDFLDYFTGVGPLLERDPSTTFVLSAWNDNGLKGKVGVAVHLLCLTKTDYLIDPHLTAGGGE